MSESLEHREPVLLDELQCAADRLKLVSPDDIRNEIDATVDETVVLWNDSRKSLRGLCERYEHAVKIWATYRKNSDIVNEWVDNQLNSLANLPTEEALNQLHVRLCSMHFNLFIIIGRLHIAQDSKAVNFLE